MKGLLYTLFFLLVVAGVCALTCPDKNAHSEVLEDSLNTELLNELNLEEGSWLGDLSTAVGSSLGGWYLENQLTVEDYFVCSVGYLTFDEEPETVSVGILNRVFVIEREEK